MLSFEELLIKDDDDFQYFLEVDAIEYAKENSLLVKDFLIPVRYNLSQNYSFDILKEKKNVEYVFVPDAKLFVIELDKKNINLNIKSLLNEEKNITLKEVEKLKEVSKDIEAFKTISNDCHLNRYLNEFDTIINKKNINFTTKKVKEIKFSSEQVPFGEFLEKLEGVNGRHIISDLVIAVCREDYSLTIPYVLKYLKQNFTEKESSLLLKKYYKVTDGKFKHYSFRDLTLKYSQ